MFNICNYLSNMLKYANYNMIVYIILAWYVKLANMGERNVNIYIYIYCVILLIISTISSNHYSISFLVYPLSYLNPIY